MRELSFRQKKIFKVAFGRSSNLMDIWKNWGTDNGSLVTDFNEEALTWCPELLVVESPLQ
jgi:hypothetical protein